MIRSQSGVYLTTSTWLDLARRITPGRYRSWPWIYSTNGLSRAWCDACTDTMPSLSPGASSTSASARGKTIKIESASDIPAPCHLGLQTWIAAIAPRPLLPRMDCSTSFPTIGTSIHWFPSFTKTGWVGLVTRSDRVHTRNSQIMSGLHKQVFQTHRILPTCLTYHCWKPNIFTCDDIDDIFP